MKSVTRLHRKPAGLSACCRNVTLGDGEASSPDRYIDKDMTTPEATVIHVCIQRLRLHTTGQGGVT